MDTLITTRKLALDKGKPKASPDCEDRFERSALQTPENYCARWTSACLGQWENTGQDAQKVQTSHPPNPAAPRRVAPRARPQTMTAPEA